MTDSVQKTLTSLRLTVCCLGSALHGEQPGLDNLLQRAQESLLTARSAADDEREYEVAAEIDDLRHHVNIFLQMQELRTRCAQPQFAQTESLAAARTFAI